MNSWNLLKATAWSAKPLRAAFASSRNFLDSLSGREQRPHKPFRTGIRLNESFGQHEQDNRSVLLFHSLKPLRHPIIICSDHHTPVPSLKATLVGIIGSTNFKYSQSHEVSKLVCEQLGRKLADVAVIDQTGKVTRAGLVTGGCSGVGAVMARAFHKRRMDNGLAMDKTATFTVHKAGRCDVLIVAGGGGGMPSNLSGCYVGGGGGGGQVIHLQKYGLGVLKYNIVVGRGGPSSTNGNPSSFDSITAIGGGAVSRSGGSGAGGGREQGARLVVTHPASLIPGMILSYVSTSVGWSGIWSGIRSALRATPARTSPRPREGLCADCSGHDLRRRYFVL